MGQAKKRLTEIEEEENYNSEVTQLLSLLFEAGSLKPDSAIEGITKRVRAEGMKSLTEGQRNEVERFVEAYKSSNVCKGCSNANVPILSDYVTVAEDGICSSCVNDRERAMAD